MFTRIFSEFTPNKFFNVTVGQTRHIILAHKDCFCRFEQTQTSFQLSKTPVLSSEAASQGGLRRPDPQHALPGHTSPNCRFRWVYAHFVPDEQHKGRCNIPVSLDQCFLGSTWGGWIQVFPEVAAAASSPMQLFPWAVISLWNTTAGLGSSHLTPHLRCSRVREKGSEKKALVCSWCSFLQGAQNS